MARIKRLVLYLGICSLAVGFRVNFQGVSWNITENDPYLWVKPCSRAVTIETNDVNGGDELEDFINVSNVVALQSIINDVNNIYGSYLRLELYPEDVNGPFVSANFTEAKAEKRTIEICTGDPTASASGHAKPKYDDGQVVGCTIVYQASAHKKMKDYIGLIAHEIGHCLGLGHPQELVDAVMSYYRDRKKIYRYSIDDKAGIRHLYPATIEGLDHKEEPTFGLSCDFKR